jgi:cytochrome oxidase assembly protein ShyY1
MNRWRFAISRRWFGYLAFAIIFAIACACLASWQVARGKQAAAANALVSHNFYSDPVPLADALPGLGYFKADQEWKRVTVTGEFVQADQLLVRNRATSKGQGFEVLTPMRLADGSIFIVDRGWVGAGQGGQPEAFPAAEHGQVTAVVRLKPSEPALAGQHAQGGQIPTVQLSLVKRLIGADAVYTAAYGLLDTETPQPAQRLERVVASPPTADEGLHWSYTIQWIIFALIGFFGLGYAVRQEYKRRNEDDPEVAAKEAERERRKALRPRTDAEIEDALIASSGPPRVPVPAGGAPRRQPGEDTVADASAAKRRDRYGR